MIAEAEHLFRYERFQIDADAAHCSSSSFILHRIPLTTHFHPCASGAESIISSHAREQEALYPYIEFQGGCIHVVGVRRRFFSFESFPEDGAALKVSSYRAHF